MNKTKKGFTLVEVIAAVAILSILSLGAFTLLLQGNKQSTENELKIESATTMQGIGDFLFAERNNINIDYFKKNLEGKSIVIQSNNVTDIAEVLSSQLVSSKNVYFNNSTGPIKYIINLNTKKIGNMLYEIEIELYTLQQNKEYSQNKTTPLIYGEKYGYLDKQNIIIQAISISGGNSYEEK